jgi:hypothetical protein
MAEPQSLDSRAFDPTRTFQMWRYNVSHSQLLLRSTKDDRVATRIDALFKGVRAVNLPTLMTALEIARSGSARGDGLHYTVRFAGGEGYVVADAVFVVEDEREYDEPGAFVFSDL